jgi:excisionase family DNA binding protein
MFDLLTLTQAAGFVGMPRVTIWWHVDRKNLPARKLGSNLVVKRSDLMKWLADYRAGKWPVGRPAKEGQTENRQR